MDFFERAHVPKKSPRMEKKPDEAVKRQLKHMMHAYKSGNNQEIINSSKLKPRYDLDETISFSDFSETSIAKEADNTMDTVTSNVSDDLQSTSNGNNSSKSSTDEHTQEDSLEDPTDDFKALSTSSEDDSGSNSLDNASAVVEGSDSNESEFSIPSSLQISTGSPTDVSDDEEFDADGILASKILENLGLKDKNCKKRKVPKKNDEPKISKDVNNTKPSKSEATQKKSKKPKQEIFSNSTEFFTEEYFSSDTESDTQYQVLQELKKDTKNETKSKKPNQKRNSTTVDLIDESINNSLDSVSSSFSSPFVSVSAEDMPSQSFDDLLGSYVHPTIRNLPTEKQNVIPTKITSRMFPTDTMFIKDVIEDDISSLVPEVDEELRIEDLNIETDTQELIEESFDIESPAEDIIINPEEPTDTLPIDTTVEDVVENEELHIKLYSGKEKFIIVMEHPAELHIHGKVQVADINGTVKIFGYKLRNGSINLYAPYTHFAICIKTLKNTLPVNPDLLRELTSAGVSEVEAKEIVSTIKENSAVIVLSKLINRKLDFVANHYNTIDLFSKRGDSTPHCLKKAAEKLGCSIYLKAPKKKFEEKEIWDDIYFNFCKNGNRGIVCGGKGTGKSTFVRHYVNTLLRDGPVLVIDLDPGQSEFTVPGNISATVVRKPLIGPNFTHLKTPDRMLNIGVINTMENGRRYLSAVNELLTYCHNNEEYQELPCIVNTMGMTNHMGLKFMTYIIIQVQPTFLYQIDSKVPKKRFEVELDPLTVTQLYEEYHYNDRRLRGDLLEYSFLISRPEENASSVKENGHGFILQPRDERYLNILAYFGELLNENGSKGLLDIVPYEVNIDDLNFGVNVKLPSADVVGRVINGKIVALCQQTEEDKMKLFILEDKALLCHGHGLVRNIDFARGILYILTPTPIGKLRSVDTLVYSDWMPELRGQEQDLPCGTSIPYRTASTVLHHRNLMFPPRRRFNPVQLLRMSRNT